MSSITVRRVESKADKQAYFEFPWKLYKDSPLWVPPLKSIRKQEMDQNHAAAWEYMEGDFYLAERDGETVGIITAYVSHRHNETWDENIAWFGDFHFIDDVDVCRALLETAENWAKERGYDGLRGPATYTLHAEVGVLIEGFDLTPIILTPYNYPYYDAHIQAAGFPKVMDLVHWAAPHDVIAADDNPMFQKMQRIVLRNNERRGITVRTGKRSRGNGDFELIRDLYNTAWKDNWGFVPLTERELEEMVRDLKQFYEPEMTFFADVKGDPAGYMLAVPDLNQAIRKAYPRPGVPEVWSLIHIFWHWKIRPAINQVRVALMGIKEEYRTMGVDGALFLAAFAKAREMGWANFTGGWVLEHNNNMNQMIVNMGGSVDRRFRLYQKDFEK
jgi:GNAT superfamily N-acetyltransferase